MDFDIVNENNARIVNSLEFYRAGRPRSSNIQTFSFLSHLRVYIFESVAHAMDNMRQSSSAESEQPPSRNSVRAVINSSSPIEPSPARSEWNFDTIMTVLISLRFLLTILIRNPPPKSRDPSEYTAWLMNIIGLAIAYVRENSRAQFDMFDRSYHRWKDQMEQRESA